MYEKSRRCGITSVSSSNPRTDGQALMDDTSGRMIRAGREDKSNSETLEKNSRPVRNERKPRSCFRQPTPLRAGRGQEQPGSSGRTCHRQPPAGSTIDHGGTPRHRGQFLVRIWGLAWSPARLICATFLCCAVLTFSSVTAQQPDGSEDKPCLLYTSPSPRD